jgi:thiopeptide-type bacteriocin biosynthesis protein
LIQVDFQRAAAHATLGPDVVDAVHVGIRALRAFESDTAETSLTRFRDAFVHRWEMRAVPLLEALDPDRGLSFPLDAEHLHAPLLRGLGIEGSAGARSLPWRKQEQWLLERLHEAWSSGGRELRFSPADIPEANRRRPPLPDAFHAFVELLGRPDGRPVVHLKSVGGPSGARLFGRFCAMDRTLTRRVREHLALEEAARPDVVFAEIAHLPEGRIGNIACRPLLRAHEIPILGRSGAPAKRCIPLQDLLLSVRDGRLVLTSRRFGKEIAPRLTNAHNVSHRSVPVYRLLAALGLQNVDAWLGWSWGPFSTAPFLPRVVVDGVILERATWNVPRPKWMGSGVSVVDAEEVTAFRAQRGMPRHVALVQDDNELPVDFDDPDSVAALQVATHKLDRMTLAEFLPAEFEPLVRGPEGGYAGEIVLPFHRVRQNVTPDLHDAERRQAADTRTLGSRSSTVPVLHARTFAPASEWLYARIYCGGVAADRVLSALHPKIAQARDAALVRRWFFIRYGEDGWHLRLRFLGEPDALSARLLPVLGAVVDPLLRQGVVHRMAIDTYEREVERYGGPAGIEACEQIFEADSDAVMDLLPCMLGDDGADRRWQWTLLSVSRMLDTFTLAPDERLALLRTVRDGLFEEFGGAHALHVRLGERFRRERTALENLREAAGDDANASLVRAALDRRDAQMREPIEMLRRLAHVHRLATPLVSVAASCVHMTVNRMLRSQARAQELVIYDFLGRLDSGRAARARAATPAHAPTARGPETPASATAPTGAPETTRVAGA